MEHAAAGQEEPVSASAVSEQSQDEGASQETADSQDNSDTVTGDIAKVPGIDQESNGDQAAGGDQEASEHEMEDKTSDNTRAVLEEGSLNVEDEDSLSSTMPKEKAANSTTTARKTRASKKKDASVADSKSIRRTRPTRRTRNTSAIKAKLDLSDSDVTSDKENEVF
ncbi:predicted protein [Nematostella vectensis]|uniref:Uncharacterized protein n=2 Tax=Nematostella vectensis TaxID=45351 RepID=A7RH23_NEMVE|nr:predicted protein [Nematostella vectensis]|eukprot:XP_001641342.1 predicted protein [Nematostella vectensis]